MAEEKVFTVENLCGTDEFSGYIDIAYTLFNKKDKVTRADLRAAIKKHENKEVN